MDYWSKNHVNRTILYATLGLWSIELPAWSLSENGYFSSRQPRDIKRQLGV